MTSKEAVERSLISNAVHVCMTCGIAGYEATLRRIQEPDMMGRDLTRAERNLVRAYFGERPEVSETEQCA